MAMSTVSKSRQTYYSTKVSLRYEYKQTVTSNNVGLGGKQAGRSQKNIHQTILDDTILNTILTRWVVAILGWLTQSSIGTFFDWNNPLVVIALEGIKR